MTLLRYLAPTHLRRLARAVREDGLKGALHQAWIVIARDRAAKGHLTPAPPARPLRHPPPGDYLAPFWREIPEPEEMREAVTRGYSKALREAPKVSVIIPVHDHFPYTLRCLWSLLFGGCFEDIEVLVIDDCSSDETASVLSDLPGLVYLRNEVNLGFLRSCNRSAAVARGEVLYFLNNDTAVLGGWIETVLATFAAHPEVGLVGSKLIYPDGLLQEAGAYLWSGGQGHNVGRFGDPDDPGYNYLRDVDYVSGAGIAVRRAAWDDVGGFDARYAPAYCEDADLAMALRRLGWRVLYQPRSEVVHFEGVSSGTDPGGGVKAYQAVNFERFAQKWAWALEDHVADHRPDPRALVRPPRPRLCFIDATVPTPDRDAGSVVALWYLRLFLDLGYDITFIPENLHLDGAYGRRLQSMGIEVLHTPHIRSVEAYLRDHAGAFAGFLLARVDAGGRFAALIRALAPDTPVIFNTVDLHYLRLEREATLIGNPPEAVMRAAETKARELALIDTVSAAIIVSEHERAVLEAEGRGGALAVIPLILEARDFAAVPPRKGRTGIAFVGGYRHPPNVDAVLWFCDHVWPALHAAQPDLTFHVAGSNAPPEITGLDIDGVVVHGHVPDLDGFLDARIATVAPLRYGAGIKGKVGSSLAAGLPCIASSIAVEGMGLKDGTNVLVADTPDAIVAAIGQLIRDNAAWKRLSRAGLDFVTRTYSPGITRQRLLRLMAQAGVVPFSGTCPITGRTETRRLRDPDDLQSLAPAPNGATTPERLLAEAILEAAATDSPSLAATDPAAIPPVALCGELPALENMLHAKARLSQPDQASLHAVSLPDRPDAAKTLAKILKTTKAKNLVIATNANTIPIVKTILKTNLWTPRTTQIKSTEAAITKTKLITARRIFRT